MQGFLKAGMGITLNRRGRAVAGGVQHLKRPFQYFHIEVAGRRRLRGAGERCGAGLRTSSRPVKGLLGSDPYDELSLGKKYFRTSNYGLAEEHFRAAVEKHPRDAEAWIGLAASYDRLRRFDLADSAYGQAVGIVGPTVEILNNQGFSYMLRGDHKRAHAALAAAQRKDPGNKYVQNNLRLLEESYRKGKSVE